MRVQAQFPEWSAPLFEPRRHKWVRGGRASGKTWTFARALAILGVLRAGLRVACVREHQRSISESAKYALELAIDDLGLAPHYRVLGSAIHGPGGGRFIFRGMSTATMESLRGLEDIDICWVEEAQRMTQRSREILFPTIRKPGSEIWGSWNPKSRADPAWREFGPGVQREDAWTRHVNFLDNPWFPPEAELERQATLRDEPERYAHVWLGEPDDEGAERKVLPYALLLRCVDGWERRPADGTQGTLHAGLDVADTGEARNALVARRGPCIVHAERWSESSLGKTARRAHAWCQERGAAILYYDAGGVGAGVKSYLGELGAEGYARRGINFGGEVAGAESQYSRGATNAEFFRRRNAQLGWGVRLRAQRTRRLLDGEDIDPARCLFIDPTLPRIEAYLAQLAQAAWRETDTGHVTVDKQPREPGQAEPPSPDLYDATVLAFAHDSRYGLRAAL